MTIKLELAKLIYKSKKLNQNEKIKFLKELKNTNKYELMSWVNNKLLIEQSDIVDQIIDDIISQIGDPDYEYTENQEPIVKRTTPPASEL